VDRSSEGRLFVSFEAGSRALSADRQSPHLFRLLIELDELLIGHPNRGPLKGDLGAHVIPATTLREGTEVGEVTLGLFLEITNPSGCGPT
jgi:hypothetical protein